VAGAGCGGLAAAITLSRDGHEVTIVERAPALTEVGAGVVMGPHAMRALDHLGAGDHIRALNSPPNESTQLDLLSGEQRVQTILGETGRKLYGTELYSTHRRDLIDALAGQLDGVRFRLSSNVVAIEQDYHSAAVVLEDGERVSGDIVVGADGLRSTVRTALFGESPALFTGFLAWRTVLPTEVLGHPLPRRSKLWTGSGRHVVHYPIRHGKQFYAAFYVPAHHIHREDWSTSGDVSDLRASFSDACPEVRRLTEKITTAFITGIYYRDPLPTWHHGRVVLLGDAAHPVLPTSGSGAAVALEDSIALAGCLRRHGNDITCAFDEFEARRKPRTTRLLISSRADLNAYHEEDPVKLAARAPMNRAIMRLDPTGFERIKWLYCYDEVEASKKDLRELLAVDAARPLRPEAKAAFDFWSNLLRPEDSLGGWASEREAYNRSLESTSPIPADLTVEPLLCQNVPALRIGPPNCEPGPTVFHLHGGGFAFGSAKGSSKLAADFARALGGWAIAPDFRKVPEFSPEEMLADVRAAYEWLATKSHRIVITAEDSGATLALMLTASLRDEGRPLPAAIFLISPFVDLSLTASSIDGNARTEAWYTRQRLLLGAGAYLQDHELDSPKVAPLTLSLAGFPPMRIAAAKDEMLADDARRLAELSSDAGVNVRCQLIPDSVHQFARFPELKESRQYFIRVKVDMKHIVRSLGEPANPA
jgi:salicylate hydroxylase